MLFRITDHCLMNCKHCMVMSNKNGQHMTDEMLEASYKKIAELKPLVVLVSGGEPTDHPKFNEILKEVRKVTQKVLVASHGLWLSDEALCKEYLGKNPDVGFQITNDKRYYPKQLCKTMLRRVQTKYKNVMVETRIRQVYPQGRAIKYMDMTIDNTEAKGPKCFNMRSLLNQQPDMLLPEAIKYMEMYMNRFCTPSIHVDGAIGMGESNQCPTIATVHNTNQEITDAFRNSQCNDCGMVSKLSTLHHVAIRFYPEGV